MEENEEKINSKTPPWWRYIKRVYTTLQQCDFHELALQFTMCNWVTSYHGWISQDGVYVPRRYQKPALPPSVTVLPLKKITYDQEFKEDEDETIIQEHDIISESDIENIYTDEELSADDYDWIAFILFWVYHF